MRNEELISLIQTYGVTEEKAKEIAEYIGDKSFYIGKGDTKPKDTPKGANKWSELVDKLKAERIVE